MSYASFLKSVPEILSQPTGIAAIASLGIHGAIAFILPLMPVESAKSNKEAATTPKPIGLSELSSNEQSRIPQKAPTAQPGIQSQLPPLPNQIPQLPTQQQIPVLPGSSTALPPSPPLGSTGSVLPPGGSNSSAFTPLQRASDFNVSALPSGGSSVQKFRNNLNLDPSRYSSRPMMSSRLTPGLSSSGRNYNSDLGFSRQTQTASRPVGLSELPNTAPTNLSNFPVEPPPMAPGDMATPPIGNTGVPVNNNLNDNLYAAQPVNSGQVEPNSGYIAPIYQNQNVSNSNLKIAHGTNPLPTFQPQSGSVLDNLNRPTNTQEGNAQQNTQQNNINDAIADARIFGDFKKEFPQGELRAPINLPIDQTKLDTNVRVSLVMDGQNKISDFKLAGDAAKLPFPKQQAIRERLQQYFKENPTSTNGKGALFSFVLSPGQVNSTSTASTPTGALQNNQTLQTAPGATDIMGRLSGVAPNSSQPVTVPQLNNPVVNSPINNTNTTTNSTQAPVKAPLLPGALKPLGGALPEGQQAIVPQLPLQKPVSSTELPQTLRNVQPAPIVAPSKRTTSTQSSVTASQPSRNALVTKLRNTQSSESNSETSLIEKLRKVKQQRESTNQENPTP